MWTVKSVESLRNHSIEDTETFTMKRKHLDTTGSEANLKKLKSSVNFSLTEQNTKFEKRSTAKKFKELSLKSEEPPSKQSSVISSVLKRSNDIKLSTKSEKKFIKEKISFQQGKSLENETSIDKVYWLDFKKKKKILKTQRKLKKLTNLYNISVNAKKIGEKLRVHESSIKDRLKLSLKLHELLKGHYTKFIFTHDISRVIQWLIKYSNAEIRHSIKLELEPVLVEMFQSKYAKNCIKAAFQYGSDQLRKEILSACNGHVIKLSSHLISAPVFEYVVSNFATYSDKIFFKQEFYGDLYKQEKDENIKSLEDVYKDSKEMKKATLSAVKANLNRVFNKKLATSPIIHTVLCEFLSNCTPEDRSEIIPMLRTLITDLSKTKEGAIAGMITIWHGSNKDRKIIMKSLKDHVKELSFSEHGHLLLFALIDSVDDTVLLKKIIISEILNNCSEIVQNEHGRKVILYLVARRDSHYFHPTLVEFLKKGDANATTKKPSDIREKEILESVINKFLESITMETETWLLNASIQMVTLAILKSNHERNLNLVFKAIVDLIVNMDLKIIENDKEYNVIEHAGLHLILKKLLQASKIFVEKNKTSFGEIIIHRLDHEILKNWIQVNRGCFLLILILENSTPPVVSTLLTNLNSLKTELKLINSSGCKILLRKLEESK